MYRAEEDKIIDKLTVDQTYSAAKNILSNAEVKIGKFVDVYKENAINNDLIYVQEKEQEFTKTNIQEREQINKLATIFEAIIYSGARFKWFGPNTLSIKTSKYDDFKNGIDIVIESQENDTEKSYSTLMLDITFCPEEIQSTFNRIKKEIESGELTKIKYFQSKHQKTKRGELSKTPRVVISVDTKKIKTLGEMWLENDKEALEKDPIQLQILEEISLQLETFQNYAAEVEKQEITGIYKKALETIQKIYNEKRKLINDSGMRDNTFGIIESALNNF